jgi:hypothetical protein
MLRKKLKPGPSDPIPQSGYRHGYENRRKLISHVDDTIDFFEALDEVIADLQYIRRHGRRHACRVRARGKGERLRDHER